MSETYNKEDLIRHLELLTPSGYSLNSDGLYEKIETGKKIEIFISTDQYFPSSVTFGSVGILIRYENVESIFATICSNTSNIVYEANNENYTFSWGFGDDIIGEDGVAFLRETEVSDDSTFQMVRPKLEDLLNAALNFIATYDTLQKCYDFGETLSGDDKANFYSQPLPSRKMIIMKIIGNSNYSSYAASVVNYYNIQSDTAKANFYQVLKTYLDSL